MSLRIPSLRPLTLSRPDRQLHPALRRWTSILDDAIHIPGTSQRIGVDGLLGMIPGLGDGVTLLMAYFMLQEARRLELPKRLRHRMLWNYALDFTIGLVPILGDIFDFAFKAHRKNLEIMERYLAGGQAGTSING